MTKFFRINLESRSSNKNWVCPSLY